MRRLRTIFSLFVASLILASQIPLAQAQQTSYRVLGKGVENRKTGDILQLACVGEMHPGRPEPACDRLQFLIWNPHSTQQLLTGPVLIVPQDGTKLKKFFHAEISAMVGKPEIQTRNVFSATRGVYGSDEAGPKLVAVGGAIFLASAASASMPLTGLIVAGSFIFFPVTIDLLMLPVRATKALASGNLFISSRTSRSMKAIGSRSKLNWQFRPHKISAKSYDRILRVLSPNEHSLATGAKFCKFSDLTVLEQKSNGEQVLADSMTTDKFLLELRGRADYLPESSAPNLAILYEYREAETPQLCATYEISLGNSKSYGPTECIRLGKNRDGNISKLVDLIQDRMGCDSH